MLYLESFWGVIPMVNFAASEQADGMTSIPATDTAPTATAPSMTAPAAQSADRTLGILSLVTSLVSIVTGFVPLGSALAIVLGAVAMRREPASGKLATAGILVGAISIALTVGAAILVPLGLLAALPFGLWGLWF